jgi:DNA (cytosine-5)-methyltransferase 1
VGGVINRELLVADLFCGAGGSSTGLARACEELGVPYRLTAVNHWDVAIATHTANHPDAKHLCRDVDQLRAGELAEGRRLDILWASPSCTEHSYAKGGHDVDDQNRVSAWAVTREVERYRPKIAFVENVPPFRNWGPVEPDERGRLRPIKSRRGETFRAWFASIESMGYTGRWWLINAAEYGEPQTRVRFFACFTAPGVSFELPTPTHGPADSLEVAQGLRKRYVSAREIIDWGIAGESIFERKRPLSPNTMRRIEAGIRRYCSGALAEAFLVVLRNHADVSSLDDPTPTIVAGGTHVGLAEPELRPFVLGQHGGGVARGVDEPLPTVTTDGFVRVFDPIVVDVRHGADAPARNASIDDPLSTLTAKNGLGIAEPFIVPQPNEQDPKSVEDPLGSITTTSRGVRLIEPFVVSYAERDGLGSGKDPNAGRSVDDPLGTVITRDRFGLAEPFVVSYYGDSEAGGPHAPRSVNEPIPTVTTANRFGVVEPYLVAHFGEREDQAPRTHAIDDPLPTVTHRGAGDLVEPVVEKSVNNIHEAPRGRVVMIDGKPYVLDVRFRMLQPSELSRAQGFPVGYTFTGTKSDQTAQIGNAVPVGVAYALIRSALDALGLSETGEGAAA